VIVAEVLESGCKTGYNARTGKFEDLVKSGVIDPAKVSRAALQHAASVAGLLLTTDLMVTDLSDDESEAPIPGAVI
jgi:chaperonin GroEL